MTRRFRRFTAGLLVVAFTSGLTPLPVLAANGDVTDTQSAGTVTGDSRASNTGVAINPNDPRNYPYGYYPNGSQYGYPSGPSRTVPTLIGAAFGGLLGAHFGIAGTLAGAVAGGAVGRLVGGQIGEQPYGNYTDNYNNRLDRYFADQYSNVNRRQSNWGMLPGIAGGVFGALLGSTFGGTLGLIAGGIGGFIVGQVFARVLFPQQYYDNYMYGGNYPFDSFRQMPQQFRNPATGQPAAGYPGYGYPGAGSSLEGYYGNGAPGNLTALRGNFLKASSTYEGELKSGTNESKMKARAAFESARDAYFSQKGQKNP